MKEQTKLFNTSAYGGQGWLPRSQSLAQELGNIWGTGGISNEYSRLKAVILHRPGAELMASLDPKAVLMLDRIDLQRAQAQHDDLARAYREFGVTVHYVEPLAEPSANQMFVADLMFMTPEGAILARPASTIRAGEERWLARRLADLGIPIIRSIRGHGTFEGADAMWLNHETVIIGRGLRSNDEGVAQLTSTLTEMAVSVIQIDLPYGTMHLMGMLRIVDHDLAIAWPTRLVHRAVEALKEHGYEVAFLPDDTEALQNKAFNSVTLGPRQLLIAANNPNTQAFYESLGISCHTVAIDELAKAAGAMGCLTGVLEREA